MLTTGRFLTFYRQVLLGIFLTAVTITLAPFLFILGLFADIPFDATPVELPAEPELPPWEDDTGFLLDFTESTSERIDILPPDFRVYFYWGMTALAILIIVSLFFSIRTMARRRQAVEMTEYIIQPGDLLSRLRREFEKRRKDLQDSLRGANPLARRQQILAAARIRQIYSALIELAATFGAPRDPAQTPLEYLGVLKRGLSSAGNDLQIITEAYLKIRYGELPEHAEEVQAVENAWKKEKQAAGPAVKAYEIKKKEEEKERKRMEQAR
jgi:hypothetical protein